MPALQIQWSIQLQVYKRIQGIWQRENVVVYKLGDLSAKYNIITRDEHVT